MVNAATNSSLATLLVWLQLAYAIAVTLVRRCASRLFRRNSGHQSPPKSPMMAPPTRVAVIGGGIAGVSAAWALAEMRKDGVPVDVVLFESRGLLGGNAKTFVWGDEHDAPNSVRTGLSVLGWPRTYFRNYELLVQRLNIACETVHPKFAVSVDGTSLHWGHAAENTKWQPDMRRWDAGVDWIRRVNRFFSHGLPLELSKWRLLRAVGLAPPRDVAVAAAQSTEPSFYDVSLCNPMNVVSAKFVLCNVFGVSRDFWQSVVVAVYSSSFLTGILDDIPAVIIPALDDIISVGSADPVKPLRTWSANSSLVFDAMADVIGRASNIRLNAKIDSVRVDELSTGREVVSLHFSDGSRSESFDKVIFACPANSIDKLTSRCGPLRRSLFNTVIGNIRYETERDRNFVDGDIHTDRRVIPAPLQATLFSQHYSNYVRVLDANRGKCCNVFCLGTWIPPALRAVSNTRFTGVTRETRHSGGALDLYVSYDAQHNADRSGVHHHKVDEGAPQVKPAADKIVGHVDNSFAHPVLSPTALALASALRLLQGEHGLYFCGSYATPGNGHDLSHLSGIAAAAAVVEAVHGSHEFETYVHHAVAGSAERADFLKLRKLMGL